MSGPVVPGADGVASADAALRASPSTQELTSCRRYTREHPLLDAATVESLLLLQLRTRRLARAYLDQGIVSDNLGVRMSSLTSRHACLHSEGQLQDSYRGTAEPA